MQVPHSSNHSLQEIIGVQHEKEVLAAVINHIDTKHPKLESMMLELPPEYEKSGEWKWGDDFFWKLAEYYSAKKVHIIAGDTKLWDVYNLKNTEEAVQLLAKNSFGFFIRERMLVFAGLFNGKLIKHRNEAMNDVFNIEKPEVTVIGGVHAKYLKKKILMFITQFLACPILNQLPSWLMKNIL